MSREAEMTEKTVMTTDISCGSLNTQAYDLKSHACSLPQPIRKKAAYVGSNKQELIKAVSQSLMEAVNSGEIYDLLDVINKAGLEFTEEMICELKGKLNAREMRELEGQIQEIRLVLEKRKQRNPFRKGLKA